MKTCSKCKTQYSGVLAVAFHRNVAKRDGFESRCKLCKAQQENILKRRRRDAKRYAKDKNKVLARLAARRCWGNQMAGCAVMGCAEPAEELAHLDYTLPLDVLPLCRRHHVLLDRG